MMEELVKQALSEHSALTELLAVYRGMPAIFCRELPADGDEGWGAEKYPRLFFTVERGMGAGSGFIRIRMERSEGDRVPLEEIGARIRKALYGVLLTGEGETVAAAPYPSGKAEMAVFCLFAFSGGTLGAGPAGDMARWICGRLPGMKSPGVNMPDGIFHPTPEAPAVCFRMKSDRVDPKSGSAVVWREAEISTHVIAPGQEDRMRWCKRILELLADSGEFPLEDGTPFLIRGRATIRAQADPLRRGQLVITGRYGVPRFYPQEPPLMHIYEKGEFNR